MSNILTIIQMVVAVALIVVILVQNKGVGLGEAFGGSTGIQQTRRGPEKFLFYSTIVLSVAFLGLVVTNLLI